MTIFKKLRSMFAWIWHMVGYDYYMAHEQFETKRGNKK